MQVLGLTPFLQREWTIFNRSKMDIWFTLLPSLVTLFFFTLNMSGVVGDINGIPYEHFLLPGLAIMALTYSVTSGAARTFNERFSRMYQELFSLPATRSAYVYAKILFLTFMALSQGMLFLFVGSLLFSLKLQWNSLVISLLVLLLSAISVAGIFLCIALSVQQMSLFLVISNVLGQVLIWTSSIFYPIESMPTLLQWLSYANPLSHGTNILRSVMFETKGNSLTSWLILTGFSVTFGVFAVQLLIKRTKMVV
jgi:ABC-2 type transport system permease protein